MTAGMKGLSRRRKLESVGAETKSVLSSHRCRWCANTIISSDFDIQTWPVFPEIIVLCTKNKLSRSTLWKVRPHSETDTHTHQERCDRTYLQAVIINLYEDASLAIESIGRIASLYKFIITACQCGVVIRFGRISMYVCVCLCVL